MTQPETSLGRALELLEQIVNDLLSSQFDLMVCFRKALLVTRMLGWGEEEKWIEQELKGDHPDVIPSHREAPATLKWVGHGINDNVKLTVAELPELRPELASAFLPQPIAELLEHKESGFVFSTPDQKTVYAVGKNVDVRQVKVVGVAGVRQVLERTGNVLFDFASKALIALRFGNVSASIFQQYQIRVDPVLARVGAENHLETAYQNLNQGNPASWQAAVLACRNVLQSLAQTLWAVPNDTYPYLKASGSSGDLVVTQDRVRNRLRAYLHQKGISAKGDKLLIGGLERATALVDDLYGEASAGKAAISYEDAQNVIIQTYLFLGELVRLTDIEPVIEIHAPS